MNRGKSRQVLSTKQLFAILISGILGNGLVSISRPIVIEAGPDGWISMVLAGMLALVGVNTILFLMKSFPDKSFMEVSETVLGKYLGKIPGIMLFLYYLTLSTIGLRVMADMSSTWLLVKTPIEIIILTVAGILYYLTRNGVKVLGRFNEMVLWILVPIFPLLFVPFLAHGNLLNLLPVLNNGVTPVLKGTLPAMYAFLGFESLLIFYPYVREDASHIEVVKISNFAVILVILVKTFVVFGNVSVFGAVEMEFLLYPLMEYFKLVVFPVIERVEFLLIFYWMFIFFATIALYFYMSNLTIEQLLKIDGYKNTGFFLILPLYFLTRIPQNLAEVFAYMKFVGTWGPVWIFATIIPVFVVSLIRGRGKSNEA